MMTKPVQEFKDSLVQLGYSKNSIYMLPELVKDFLRYHRQADIQQMTQKHIQSYYKYLQIRPHKRKEGGLSECYISHHIYALRLFFAYLEQTGVIRYNPISVMKFKRPQSNTRQPLTKEDISRLFESAGSLKERAILHLFYSCGLRRSEGVALNIRDIHFKTGLLYVREGKGHKRRVIPLTARVSRELEAYYLQERSDVGTKARDSEAFILGYYGFRMNGQRYNMVVQEIVRRAGIDCPCTLHHLRHSIATHLLENGLSLENVRDFLGHSYLESTQIYAKISKHQLKNL